MTTRALPIALLAGAALVVATNAQTQLPAGHPPTGAPAVEDAAQPPPAAPEDVASIDAIIDAFYHAISGEKGEQRSWDRLRSLFKPMSRMIAARPAANGGAGLWALKPDDFIDFNSEYFEASGYCESEAARRIERFGNIAHVWSTYESRRSRHDHVPYARGIYSFQLLKDGDRWWIVNAYWDFERPDEPIPERYLQTPHEEGAGAQP